MPGQIKYSSNYSSLQAAFNDLKRGDILYVNKNYTLSSTVTLSQYDVQIYGIGDPAVSPQTPAQLKPQSNGNPSPLIQIKPTQQVKQLQGIIIGGLELTTAGLAADGTGLGTAIEVFQDGGVSGSNIWHVKLDNLHINNFEAGIVLDGGVFDVIVENCRVAGNVAGLHMQRRSNQPVPSSSIRVISGFFTNNTRHISVDTAATGGAVYPNGFEDIYLFGLTCGHKRTGGPDSDGVTIYWPTGHLAAIGCHFEDLAHAVHVFNANPSTPSTLGELTVIGCQITGIKGGGITAFVNASVRALSAIGNRFTGETSSVRFLETNPVTEGVLVGGNTSSPLPTSYPATGYLEVNKIANKIAYRVSQFSTANRPSPSDVLEGTIIFNTDTKKLNTRYRDSQNQPKWYNPDGTLA